MKTNLKIASNFILDNKKQTFLITLGIAMGIAIQFFMINLLPSLQKYMVEKTLGNGYHIKIEKGESRALLVNELRKDGILFLKGNSEISQNRISDYEKTVETISKIEGVRYISGNLSESALYSKNGKSRSMAIFGTELETADKIYNLKDNLVDGKATIDSDNILVGTDFIKDFNLTVGDTVVFRFGSGMQESFRIAGVLDLGSATSNKNWIFMNINKLQYITDKKGVISTLDLKLDDPFKSDDISDFLSKRFPDLKVNSWTKDMPDLLTALKSQMMTIFTIQFFITLATAMSISSILGITVLQKSKQLGILKTMGLSNRDAMEIFIFEGAIFGTLSTILGLLIGTGIIALFQKNPNLVFPINIKLKYTLIITTVSIISAIIASIFPAIKSKRLNPIDIIRGN